MIPTRFRFLLLAACCICEQAALAQESTGGTSTAAPGATTPGPAGASSAFGAPSTGGAASPFAPETTPSTTPPVIPPIPSFRTGEAAADGLDSQPGAASSFGTGPSGADVMRSSPASFTVPGFYGRGAQQFVVGEGRLARPRFRINGKVSMGYDDNVFQTPTHGQSVRPQRVPVLVSPGSPGGSVLVTVPSGDPAVPATQRVVEVPAMEPTFRYETIPGTPAPQRVGSFVTRSSAGFDVQLANRRNLFTFDLNAGASYYWDRPGKKTDYNGNLSLIYLRKLTGRAQFTLALSASYQNEPDFSQVNSPTSNNVGSYLSTNAKADLSYRLTPRFSTVTSMSYSSRYSAEQSQSSGDYAETTFGTELRYLFSPRLTLLGDVRYSSSVHQDDAGLDTNTYFVLLGGELTLTRRFTASLRIGESLQTYSESGSKSSSPYLESTLSYRLTRGTTIQWNARYGYEESSAADSETLVLRSGLSLTHIFSPRLQASLSANFVRSEVTSTSEVAVVEPTTSDPTALTFDTTAEGATSTDSAATEPAVPETKSVTTKRTTDTIDATFGLNYTLSRRWSFNLSYTYTMSLAPVDTGDYYRQQIFLGAEYQF